MLCIMARNRVIKPAVKPDRRDTHTTISVDHDTARRVREIAAREERNIMVVVRRMVDQYESAPVISAA